MTGTGTRACDRRACIAATWTCKRGANIATAWTSDKGLHVTTTFNREIRPNVDSAILPICDFISRGVRRRGEHIRRKSLWDCRCDYAGRCWSRGTDQVRVCRSRESKRFRNRDSAFPLLSIIRGNMAKVWWRGRDEPNGLKPPFGKGASSHDFLEGLQIRHFMFEFTPLLRIVTLASCNPVGAIDLFPILYDWLANRGFFVCASRRKGRGSFVQHFHRVTL